MAKTIERQLNDTWEAVATGGDVLLSLPYQHDGTQVRYAFTDDAATPPTVVHGHKLTDEEERPMSLGDTETLWLRGNDLVVITAQNPV